MNKEEILSTLTCLRDDMKMHHAELKKAGFNEKHLAELYGATMTVATWIAGARKL